jgi:ferrous-iron efflux pump FieF
MYNPSPSSGIRLALIISGIIAAIKLTIGLFSWSLALLGSALDSFLDMFVSGVNHATIKISEKSRNKRYTYGFGKTQWFAAIFEWIIVLSSGIFLLVSGIQSLLNHHTPEIDIPIILAMVIASIGTGLIVWNFKMILRSHNSLIVRSDMLHYTSDLFMNVGILSALCLNIFFSSLWWIDAVLGIIIGLWILVSSSKIIWSGVSMLLDRSLPEEEVQKIESLFQNHPSLEWYHFLKTRMSGDDVFIESHIVFREKDISLKEAHTISDQIENQLMNIFPSATITLHLDIDLVPETCLLTERENIINNSL